MNISSFSFKKQQMISQWPEYGEYEPSYCDDYDRVIRNEFYTVDRPAGFYQLCNK